MRPVPYDIVGRARGEPVALLAFLKGAFRRDLFVYILERAIPADDPALRIPAGIGARAAPAKTARAMPYAISRVRYGCKLFARI